MQIHINPIIDLRIDADLLSTFLLAMDYRKRNDKTLTEDELDDLTAYVDLYQQLLDDILSRAIQEQQLDTWVRENGEI